MTNLQVGLGRRRFLGGAAVLAGGAVVGSALTLGSEAAKAASPEYLTGWNIYSGSAAIQEIIDAITRHTPGVIRWQVEWDLYHTQALGGPYVPDPPNWARYRPFFEALLPSEANPAGTKLYVQLRVKNTLWEGLGAQFLGQVPGSKWAKPEGWTNYPSSVEQSYLPFVQSLRSVLDEYGLDPVWGAWNEADMRFRWNGWLMEQVDNMPEPWTCQMHDWAYWSGGAGDRWRELHEVNGLSARYNTSQIARTDFINATMAIPQVGEIALSRYYANEWKANKTVDYFAQQLPRYDAAAGGRRLPFLVTECGPDAIYAPLSTKNAARLWQRHNLLTQANAVAGHPLEGRYLGMCSHMTPNRDDIADPNWKWWEYRSEYDQYLDDEDPIAGQTPTTTKPPPSTRPQPQPPTLSPSFWDALWDTFVKVLVLLAGLFALLA